MRKTIGYMIVSPGGHLLAAVATTPHLTTIVNLLLPEYTELYVISMRWLDTNEPRAWVVRRNEDLGFGEWQIAENEDLPRVTLSYEFGSA